MALHQFVQRHVEDYSKSCTASVAWLNSPNFDWQAWEKDSQALVAASVFWTCKTEKKLMSTARNNQKKEHGIATKMNQKKRLKCAETSCLMHSVSKTLFTNVNASTRGFRSGGLFMASPLPHFGRIIHSSTRDFGRDFWCPKKLFRHRPSYRILELTDICVACFQDMLMTNVGKTVPFAPYPWQGMVTIPRIYIYFWVFIPLKLVILWLKQ